MVKNFNDNTALCKNFKVCTEYNDITEIDISRPTYTHIHVRMLA
jgi:hypothetical protein